jgi:hypothetical protein
MFVAAALGECSKDDAALATACELAERTESTSPSRISLTRFRTGSVSISSLARECCALGAHARRTRGGDSKSSFESFAGDKAR